MFCRLRWGRGKQTLPPLHFASAGSLPRSQFYSNFRLNDSTRRCSSNPLNQADQRMGLQAEISFLASHFLMKIVPFKSYKNIPFVVRLRFVFLTVGTYT